MFKNSKTPLNKRLKLTLNSHITVNLIDVIHLELHPSFVRPNGLFSIQAIGEQINLSADSTIFNVYAENDGNH